MVFYHEKRGVSLCCHKQQSTCFHTGALKRTNRKVEPRGDKYFHVTAIQWCDRVTIQINLQTLWVRVGWESSEILSNRSGAKSWLGRVRLESQKLSKYFVKLIQTQVTVASSKIEYVIMLFICNGTIPNLNQSLAKHPLIYALQNIFKVWSTHSRHVVSAYRFCLNNVIIQHCQNSFAQTEGIVTGAK